MLAGDVNEKGDYEFEHLLLTDSSLVKISLEKLPNFEKIQSHLHPQVLGRKKPFNKPIINYIGNPCPGEVELLAIADVELPKFNGKIIKLDEVVVKKKEPELTRQKVLSNSMLRGYKIDETNNHGTLLNFIQMSGFTVTRNFGDVYITSRQRMSLNSANPTPLVYLDDRPLTFSYNELDMIPMTDVDEIYINAHTMVASINNNLGVIKIYTKKPQNNLFSKPDPNSFFVKEAYSVYTPFKDADYLNSQGKGFESYGILGWSTLLVSNENGDFLFDFTDYNKPKAKIIIEGMSPDGELFHEEKTVEIK